MGLVATDGRFLGALRITQRKGHGLEPGVQLLASKGTGGKSSGREDFSGVMHYSTQMTRQVTEGRYVHVATSQAACIEFVC